MLGRREFICMMACLMATGLLAIDAVLAALPGIGMDLGVANGNDQQSVISSFWMGLGAGQLFYGPLADRYGRRPVLIGSLLAYALLGMLAALAGSMPFLLAMRFLQGLAAAGASVLVSAIIRDRFKGVEQAALQSLAASIVLLVPVVAPPLGQMLLWVASWRALLILLASAGLLLALWTAIRLPETLAPENIRPLTWPAIRVALAEVLGRPAVIGNIIVGTLMMGAFAAFIHLIPQIVSDVYGQPDQIGFVFVCLALPVAIAYLLNVRLLRRFGARELLLTALVATSIVGPIHLAVALSVDESLWVFVAFQSLTMVWIGLTNGNCVALILEPVGHIAGIVSAIRGFVTIVGGVSIGLVVGRTFDGSPMPVIAAFAACGVLALLVAMWANRKLEGAAPRVDAGDARQPGEA